MSGSISRIIAMATKELAVVLRDRRVLTTLVASPVIQLILFGLATTLEVKNVSLGLVNRDTGIVSERFLAAVAAGPQVGRIIVYPSEAALAQAIEEREVLGGLILPQNLSVQTARGETGSIGLLLDGRRVNTSQIFASYIAEIAASAEVAAPDTRVAPDLVVRNWFNPNLDYSWFTLPGMVAVITTVLVLSVSVQAIAREREFGTYDQLMALPLRDWEILAGKLVPAFLVGLCNGSFYVAMVAILSDVPFTGSYPLIVLAITCFSLAVTAVGLAISTVAANQQQAFLGGFLVIVPMILLSGYASPVDGMPHWLQLISAIDPLTHMLAICHGVFLKAMPAQAIFSHIWPMVLVAVGALIAGRVLLRARRT